MQEENLAKAIESLGIMWTPNEGDVIIDAIVIARISNSQDETSVLYETSPGSDMVIRVGLLTCAQQVEASAGWYQKDDDD